MTAYRNFVQDFPSRCASILESYQADALARDREVTLSLAIASAALVVPFERLRPSATDHIASDRSRSCVKQLGRVLALPFFSWAGGSWQEHSVAGSQIRGRTVEEWLPLGVLQPVKPERNVDSVLAVLRNALAHGNIFTRCAPNHQIAQLIFLSKRRDSDHFDLVASTPSDFLQLLHRWVHCLSDLHLPEELVQPAYGDPPSVLLGGRSLSVAGA